MQLLFNPTAEQLLFVILIIVLPIVLLLAKSKKENLEEPVMERGRDKEDYKSGLVAIISLSHSFLGHYYS